MSCYSSGDEETKVKEALPQKLDMESELYFLRSKEYFPLSSQSVRPYSLSLNEEDYHYAPKPKHLRPARLIRLLGSSFDPFWMSVERPPNAGEWITEESPDSISPSASVPHNDRPVASLPDLSASKREFNITASPELSEGAARYQRKLETEAESLDLSALPDDVASAFRKWLVRSATCSLRYQWVDLGPVFWPRWLRHTDCYEGGGQGDCSFPSGMACRRAQVTRVKILAWHCWFGERSGGDGTNGRKDDGKTATQILPKKCQWRQVPYPVVTACKCSCK